MSPHKPNPRSRKIEVDISGILIRPEELDRSVLKNNPDAADTVPTAWQRWIIGKTQPRISSSGWVNVLFATGCCVVGFYCTVSIIDSFEHSRRSAHPPAEIAYRRPDAMTWPSFELAASRSTMSIQSNQIQVKLSDRVTTDLNPTLSTFQPFHDNQRFALSPNTVRPAPFTSNLNSAHSSGAGPARMSQAESSRAETADGNRAVTSKQSRTRILPIHSRTSMLSMRSRISNARQNLRSSLTQNSSSRSPMSMHAKAQAIVALQNAAPMNCMRMQHGMIAQPAVGVGFGGLNGAGLGGAGHHGANPRR